MRTFTNQGQSQSTGSIATLVTGYQTPGSAAGYGGTFPTVMYWAAGFAAFTPAH